MLVFDCCINFHKKIQVSFQFHTIPYSEETMKKAAQKSKEMHEQSLKNLAQQAREERIGLKVSTTDIDDVCLVFFFYCELQYPLFVAFMYIWSG